MRRLSEAEKAEVWDGLERGESMRAIGRRLGRAHGSIRTFVAACAGKRPRTPTQSLLRLRLEEREEISRGLAAGESLRAIAGRVGRSPSTICREVNRTAAGPVSGVAGGSGGATAGAATQAGEARAVPAAAGRGRSGLAQLWSPQQISGWLVRDYPDDPEMQVSHETIYQSLFVQSRGALRKELHACLRTGRAMRRAKAYTKGGVGQGQIRNMVMISERPAEVADRAVPGHWEGDLIFGKKMTSIGTLVERHSRYVILLKLPERSRRPRSPRRR